MIHTLGTLPGDHLRTAAYLAGYRIELREFVSRPIVILHADETLEVGKGFTLDDAMFAVCRSKDRRAIEIAGKVWNLTCL